jgi:hypothetical protein
MGRNIHPRPTRATRFHSPGLRDPLEGYRMGTWVRTVQGGMLGND